MAIPKLAGALATRLLHQPSQQSRRNVLVPGSRRAPESTSLTSNPGSEISEEEMRRLGEGLDWLSRGAQQAPEAGNGEFLPPRAEIERCVERIQEMLDEVDAALQASEPEFERERSGSVVATEQSPEEAAAHRELMADVSADFTRSLAETRDAYADPIADRQAIDSDASVAPLWEIASQGAALDARLSELLNPLAAPGDDSTRDDLLNLRLDLAFLRRLARENLAHAGATVQVPQLRRTEL